MTEIPDNPEFYVSPEEEAEAEQVAPDGSTAVPPGSAVLGVVEPQNEEEARQALAERVRASAADEAAPNAERATRAALAAAERELTAERERRDNSEARIRELVWEVETLHQAVGVFDRRQAKRASE